MKRHFKYLVIFIVIVCFAAYYLLRNQAKKTSDSEKSSNVIEREIPLSEVKSHSSLESCWIIFEESVYDISKFISKHPGGDVITTVCGQDATEKFKSRPGSGTSHSSAAQKVLQSLRLGRLTN